MSSQSHISDGRQLLASFISLLPEAVLMCDRQGICLIHDRQAQAFLMPGQGETAGPEAMVGRPVTSFIDKRLIEHALDDIRERLAQGMDRPVSGFVLEKPPVIFQARVVPVLGPAGLFDGFVVILSDITRQDRSEKRVESLLTMLSKNARSPLASIRAAVEAMKEFPGMDEERRRQFVDIIHAESLVLSDILEQVSKGYGGLLLGKRALKSNGLDELLQTLSRRASEQLGIVSRVTASDESAAIKVEAYSFISSLLFLLERMARDTGTTDFSFFSRIKNKIVCLDIAWQGPDIPWERFQEWEARDIPIEGHGAGLSLKEILDRHHCAMWAYPAGVRDLPFVRFFIPLDASMDPVAFEAQALAPESRAQLPEMEIFSHSGQALALDNRLLTELSYTTLIREITQARSVDEIMGKHSQLPRLIHNMLSGGTKVMVLTWLITAFSDAILNRLIAFALEELGPAPVPFAFITLGSEGRKEQTLKTDQDNAVIFRGGGHAAADYFLSLGEKVCTWLDRAGYDFCRGGIMAQNPRWCRPLPDWKTYFSDWIRAPSPEDLLHTSIFFDLRFAYGDQGLVDELLAHLHGQLTGWTGFFRNMAENAVFFKPPIGLFGRFQVEKTGPHKKCLNIKMAGVPIVDFARIYSLKHGIRETSTQDRLFRLYENRVLSRREYDELDQAYGLLVQLRFREQIQRILVEKTKAANHINPRRLTTMERQMLKQALKKMKSIQDRLQVDFIGATDQQMS